jgi:hypothetical protein
MCERLGNVLYWLGCIAAAGVSWIIWMDGKMIFPIASAPDLINNATWTIPVAIPMLIGWTLRYILRG